MKKVWYSCWIISAILSFGFGLMPEEALGTWDNYLSGFFIGLSWAFVVLAQRRD